MEVISKKEAIEKGLKKYFTGKPCIRGHVDYRYTYNGTCSSCREVRGRELRAKDPEKWKKYDHEYAKKHMDKKVAQLQARRKADPEKYIAGYKAYGVKAKPQILARVNKRRADKLQATPFWSDLEEIKGIYEECAMISSMKRIEHHVDHVIPLKHKLVCGLHVPANLRIITAEENLAKNNKFEIE